MTRKTRRIIAIRCGESRRCRTRTLPVLERHQGERAGGHQGRSCLEIGVKGQIDSGYLKPLLLIGGILLSPVAYVMIVDVLPMLVHDPLAKLNTRYGPKFSFERFRQIQEGDSESRVIELIGESLSHEYLAFKPGDEGRGAYQTVKTREEVRADLMIRSKWLYYSTSKTGGDFRWIIVYLGKDDHVTGTNDFVTD
jgi:hypothetical protein